MEDWTEKYRPKSLDDIVGNRQAKDSLKRWASEWSRGIIPRKRSVILFGKPGIGKTSAALALANDFGWDIIEMNASDVRNAENVKRVAKYGSLNEGFSLNGEFLRSKSGRLKLIILDEADNLYDRKERDQVSRDLLDRGGKKAIVETIRETKHPIILIANDLYELLRGGGEPLKDLCEIIKFDEKRIRVGEIVSYLKKISRSEGINVDNDVLISISERCNGDIRSAVRDLQTLCAGRKNVNQSMLDALGYRDKKENIFVTLREIFKTKNISAISRIVHSIDEDPKSLILWISENLPYEYIEREDLSRAYENLAKADVMLGRAEKTRSYTFWRYALDLMAGGVAVSKKRFYPIQQRYSFPSWLIEMKTSKQNRDIRQNLLEKLSAFCHCSKKKANKFLDAYSRMAKNDKEFAKYIVSRLQLNRDEAIYLTGDEKILSEIQKKEREKDNERVEKILTEQKKLF